MDLDLSLDELYSSLIYAEHESERIKNHCNEVKQKIENRQERLLGLIQLNKEQRMKVEHLLCCQSKSFNSVTVLRLREEFLENLFRQIQSEIDEKKEKLNGTSKNSNTGIAAVMEEMLDHYNNISLQSGEAEKTLTVEDMKEQSNEIDFSKERENLVDSVVHVLASNTTQAMEELVYEENLDLRIQEVEVLISEEKAAIEELKQQNKLIGTESTRLHAILNVYKTVKDEA